MGKLTIIFHTIGLVHHLYVSKFTHLDLDFSDQTDDRILDLETYRYRYLTTWNLICQTIYLLLVLTLDISEFFPEKAPSTKRHLRIFLGYMFSGIIFPLTLSVSTIFWVMFSIDREFVLPSIIDTFVPSWLNHSLHTNILLLPAIEIFIHNKTVPDIKHVLYITVKLTIFYHIVLLLSYFQTSRWPYGILEILNWPQRFLLLGTNYIVGIVYVRMSIIIQKYVRSKDYFIRDFKESVVRKVL